MMKRHVPLTNQRFEIDRSGKLYEDSIPILEENNCEKIGYTFDWYDGVRFYERHFIFIVSFYAKYLPVDIYEQIQVCFRNQYFYNRFDDTAYYRFKCGPLEVKSKPGFFHIPYYTRYCVDKEGNIYDLKSCRFLKFAKTKKYANDSKNRTMGYMCGRIESDLYGISGTSRHRSLALTFIDYKDSPLFMVINHKNGVPGDDRVENLEWVTRAENNKHAIDSGLTPNSVRPIKGKNAYTNQEMKFSSLSDATRKLNVSNGAIKFRLKDGKLQVPSDGWLFRDIGESWPDESELKYEFHTTQVLALNVFTNTLSLFSSQTHASKELSISLISIVNRCRRKENRPLFGFIFRFRRYDVEWPKFDARDLEIYREFPHSGGYGVLVTKIGCASRFFASAKLASLEYGISNTQMEKLASGERKSDTLIVVAFKPKY